MAARDAHNTPTPATRVDEAQWKDPDGWFAALGVPPDAEDAVVRKALRAALRAAHPDKAPLSDGAPAAGHRTVQEWQAIERVLACRTLRWTYHTRGGAPALDGVHTHDGSERLDVTLTHTVSIGQLVLGGSAQALCMRRVHRRGQQRRAVHFEWPRGTPDGVMIKVPGKGHVEDVRHPITGATRTATGDVYIKLHAQAQNTPAGSLVALNGDLVFTPATVTAASVLSRSPIAVPIALHAGTGTVDAARGTEVRATPADGRCFARFNRVPGMGITPAHALYIVLPHTLDCLGDVHVPPGVGEALAEANACPAPEQGQVDHACNLHTAVDGAVPALHAEAITAGDFEAAQHASQDGVRDTNATVARTAWNVTMHTSDAAETAMLHQLNAGKSGDAQIVRAGDAHSVTGFV
uniref:J domain-containing protein n=1 Tax=viral metagenome TaxID=1070528 RepID=A0A6C0AT07_9ZZZZ